MQTAKGLYLICDNGYLQWPTLVLTVVDFDLSIYEVLDKDVWKIIIAQIWNACVRMSNAFLES